MNSVNKYIDINLEDQFNEDLACNIVDKIQDCHKYEFKYKGKNGHTVEEDLNELLITKDTINTIKKHKDHKFVYLIYLNNDKTPKYVGKACDIHSRIKNHLIKNDSGTKSKIKNVYESLDDENETIIKVVVFDIQPGKLYSAIEGLLISHFNCVDEGWNERDD